MERKEELDAINDANAWMTTAVLSGKEGNYNISLYSLEMSVEIGLKAVLIHLGIAYPKVHNILPILLHTIDNNKEKLPKEFVDKKEFIMDNFRELLKMRGPAGYTFGENLKIVDMKQSFDFFLANSKEVIKLCNSAVKF